MPKRFEIMKAMSTKRAYAQKLSAEIDGLSEAEMEKIVKMIRLVKKEFLEERENSIERFKRARGGWRSVEIEKVYRKWDEDWKKWRPAKFV